MKLESDPICPADAQAGFVFAHGPGAGRRHPFMEALAQALARRRIATWRFDFPFMASGSRRPDPPAVAQAAVRQAVADAAAAWPGLPLFAGGKSFGGRMSAQAQAQEPLTGVLGLAFVGYPLHPAGKPGLERARPLHGVQVPMLFLQGTRDALADLALVRQALAPLGARATLHVVEGADHGFEVLVRSGRTAGEVHAELADTLAAWMLRHAHRA
ncbi:MAG: alpha/beta family hydrolase [Ramlibacter sp.]